VYAVRYENGKTFEMGREILRHMSGRDYPDLDVLHIDGDPLNNTRKNLAWALRGYGDETQERDFVTPDAHNA
jgi:hypothetical protein